MTTPLPHEQRIADLESQVAELQSLVFHNRRQPSIVAKTTLRRAKTTTDTSYPTGYANTFELVASDGTYTRTAGSQGLTDTERSSSAQFTGRTVEGTNVIENTEVPFFEVEGDDGKTFVFIMDYATLWRFTLNENMGATTANEATADLIDLGGNNTTSDVTVYDRLGIFSSMQNLDAGFCVKQGGEYHVVQAECP